MGVKVVKDGMPDFKRAIAALLKSEVLVGIPEANNDRDDGELGNAARAYIHEFGAPEANIPARPFLIPGVEGVKDKITDRLKKAAVAALDGNLAAVQIGLNGAGLIAAAAVKEKLQEGPFVPLKDDTKRARLERREAYKNASEGRRREMMADYLAGDFTPLVDTGKMRDSITYVVQPKERR